MDKFKHSLCNIAGTHFILPICILPVLSGSVKMVGRKGHTPTEHLFSIRSSTHSELLSTLQTSHPNDCYPTDTRQFLLNHAITLISVTVNQNRVFSAQHSLIHDLKNMLVDITNILQKCKSRNWGFFKATLFMLFQKEMNHMGIKPRKLNPRLPLELFASLWVQLNVIHAFLISFCGFFLCRWILLSPF